ncbi:hypothetical protein DBR00_06055 [Pseudomonas sp. HMWF032]|uniref:PP0621 family protein n=1 Tax=unclassified Pseudomonas TaxID=196821 RepID=UPI000D3D04C6|nr:MULTISPECIES: PP0621 family protein [unclassified Pseudomonas]PTS85347.1 hypothetical protein DBR00_06055 [Pseudomonas sp. HMWF032]PTT84811.1 hypothetical protein DBR41_06455 [Pseudomonas sp. HMWF010]WAC43003.1 PP0621 family protein [Pseudomonas sp. SL4(2022)]
MGLFRLLIWIAIIAAAVWLWRRFNRPKSTRPTPSPSPSQAAPMVRCQHCDVHVPREHALASGEHWFCSQAHLEQGPRNNGH